MEAWAEARPYGVRYLAAWTPLIAAYLIVFAIAHPGPLGWSLLTAMVNVSIPLILGGVVFAIVSAWVLRATLFVQLGAHISLSLAFSWVWLIGLGWQLGLVRGLRGQGWEPVSFLGPALTWQLFQGLLVYFMVLAGIYAIHLHVRGSYLLAGLTSGVETDPALAPVQEAGPAGRPPQRLFIKSEGSYQPLDFDEIIAVSGADDYCELHLPYGPCLIRMTLSELQDRLNAEVFLRVHRSHIININRVVSVAARSGGGLTVTLQAGVSIPASRSGASALTPFLIS